MRIRYVISSMLFWGRENHLSLEQECEFLRSNGFGIELWPTIKGDTQCRYERRNWPRLAAATEDMLVSIHSRNDFPDLHQWNEQIECAKMLNANIVTDMQSLGIPENADINGAEFSAEIIKMAQQLDVKISVEAGNLEKLKKLGQKFDYISYCLDTGHMNLDKEFSFEKYIDDLAQRTSHLHLSDNYGRINDHEPPGLRGGITAGQWNYLLKSMEKYNNDIIGSLEICPCAPEVMMRQASEFLFDELSWPHRPQKQSGYTSVNYSPSPNWLL
ncbi:MAG: sugar phosphate isomerase/epimerase family protein [Planctomycetota bacterium]